MHVNFGGMLFTPVQQAEGLLNREGGLNSDQQLRQEMQKESKKMPRCGRVTPVTRP